MAITCSIRSGAISRNPPPPGIPALETSRWTAKCRSPTRRSSRDLRPVGDVARLGLGAELAGDPLQPLEASGEEDTAPAARRQEARRRGADALEPPVTTATRIGAGY